jgi:hypothetical protein
LQTNPEPFLRDRQFWVRYLKAGVDFRGCDSLLREGRELYGPRLADVSVRFEFPQGFVLTLTLCGSGHWLELTHPSLAAPAQLGWMDCQQMSDLLQREEFEALVRHLDERADPGREPWMARLLFGFYVSPLREYADWYPSMLRAAVADSGQFSTEEAAWVESYTRTILRGDFLWSLDRERGWVARGEDAYSLRTRANKEFPFALVRELLSAVEAEEQERRTSRCT